MLKTGKPKKDEPAGTAHIDVALARVIFADKTEWSDVLDSDRHVERPLGGRR